MRKFSDIGFAAVFGLICLLSQASRGALPGDEFWDNRQSVNGTVLAMAVQGKNLFVGGEFSQAGGITASNIARWDGTNWFPLGAGVDARVFGLAVSGNNLYACGRFSSAGGVAATNVARWDGTNWSGFGSLMFPYGIRAIAVSSDGHDVFAGQEVLPVAGGKYVFRWDGTDWSPLGGGIFYADALSTPVGAILVDGVNVYLGGQFRNVGGVDANDLAQWDGAQWHQVGGGVNFIFPGGGSTLHVAALAMASGELYVGGNFNSVGGSMETNASNIARWDGTNWFTFKGGVDFVVRAIALDGKDVYVAGTQWDGPAIAKWDGMNWTQLGSGITEPSSGAAGVYALAFRGTDLVAGGSFVRAGDQPAENLSIWHVPQSLEATLEAGKLKISWSAQALDYILQSAPTIPNTNWTVVDQTPKTVSGRFVIAEDPSESHQFFRLRHR